jgi:DNA-binding NarL/FixJ family response regulator
MKSFASESMGKATIKRIFIVDDHPTLREGLQRLIESGSESLKICGEAASASEAIEAIQRDLPDLVITDVSLPDKSGLELIKDLKALAPTIKILVFSMHDEMVYAERSIKAGAAGYLMKGAKTPLLLDAIERVLGGGIYLSQRMSDHLLKNLAGKRSAGMKIDALSDRELEVFELIGLCRSNAEIAEQLHISPKTVDAHRGNIKTKLNLSDAPYLMREAVLWVEGAGRERDVNE